MSKLLFDGVFAFIDTYLRGLATSNLALDILFYVFIGLEILFVIYFAIKSHFAYEFRLIRSIDKINIYLLNNSYVNENNLIEFNKKMKKVPKVLRYHWQQYMLYREKSPSHYMSVDNCIEQPIKSSSLTNNIKTMKSLTIVLASLSILLTLAVLGLAAPSSQISYLSTVLFRLSIIPTLVIVVGNIYMIYQRGRQATNLSDLYQTFHIFQRLIDKASTTIPEYVDFEVLFTKKEIQKGIPALNEYLEKRARQEQEELEKARRNAVEHEVYDFGSIDISGSLILDRAMKETEIYLSLRNRLLAEIQQTDTEIDTLKKAYDNTQREFQRKMQASKENVERFRLQLEATTNRIETNYIRKQQDDEIKKQNNLEKENADTTMRFNQDVAALTEEIDKKKAELEERRKYVEEAMIAEYKTYSTKVFKNLIRAANMRERQEREELALSKENYAQKVSELNDKVQDLSYENGELKNKIKNFDSELNAKEAYYTNALIETAERAKEALGNKSKSDYSYEEDSQQELSSQEELNQENIYEEQEEQDELQPLKENEIIPMPEGLDKEEIDKNEAPEEKGEDYVFDPENASDGNEEQPIYDEYGGYYDSEGYYRYQNGTYYDPEGNFHDEYGGYYDKEGNYFPPENNEENVSESSDVEEIAEETSENQEEEIDTNDEEVQEEISEPVKERKTEKSPKLKAQIVEPEIQSESYEEDEEYFEDEDNDEDYDEDYDEDDYYDEDEEYFEEEDYDEDKPKRGRPRKVVEEKPRRGRPKKEDKPKRGRPKKEEEKKGPGRPKKEEIRKPGRPKKEEVRGPGRPSISSQAQKASKKEEVRGPGRPKKEEIRKPGRPKKEEIRGPGRPKKEEVRGPGRPKKEEVRGPGRPKKEVKKGPGRPPKKKGPGRPKKK